MIHEARHAFFKEEAAQNVLLERAEEGDLHGVWKCIEDSGVDVNGCGFFNTRPLHAAASGGNADLVELLLHCGADPNVQEDDGMTPLHQAAAKDHYDAMRVLTRFGADLHTKNEDGDDAMYYVEDEDVGEELQELSQQPREGLDLDSFLKRIGLSSGDDAEAGSDTGSASEHEQEEAEDDGNDSDAGSASEHEQEEAEDDGDGSDAGSASEHEQEEAPAEDTDDGDGSDAGSASEHEQEEEEDDGDGSDAGSASEHEQQEAPAEDNDDGDGSDDGSASEPEHDEEEQEGDDGSDAGSASEHEQEDEEQEEEDEGNSGSEAGSASEHEQEEEEDDGDGSDAGSASEHEQEEQEEGDGNGSDAGSASEHENDSEYDDRQENDASDAPEETSARMGLGFARSGGDQSSEAAHIRRIVRSVPAYITSAYRARNGDELDLDVGDCVRIINAREDLSWLLGVIDGCSTPGWFPRMCAQVNGDDGALHELLASRAAESISPPSPSGSNEDSTSSPSDTSAMARALLAIKDDSVGDLEIASRDGGFHIDRPCGKQKMTLAAVAASEGAVDVLEWLLEHGAQPDVPDAAGGTALHAALWAGHADAAELLMTFGASVWRANSSGAAPIDYCRTASVRKRIERFDRALKSGATPRRMARRAPADVPVAQPSPRAAILRQDAARNEEAPVDDTADVDALNEALRDAAFLGNRARVRELLSRGADVNSIDKYGLTALHSCVFTSPECAKELVRKGASLEVRDARGARPLDQRDRQGRPVPAALRAALITIVAKRRTRTHKT